MSSSKSPFNHAAPAAIGLLLTRRSGSAKAMGKPGPSKQQLAEILKAGARVPDHGKLFPWRFIVFEGKGRERFLAIFWRRCWKPRANVPSISRKSVPACCARQW